MPARPALQGSFSVTDAANEVVCPLKNQDGSSCRKRCFGEKRYRSMQEHIRRAHPDYYIPKLPATEESFLKMINSDPTDKPQTNSNNLSFGGANTGYSHHDHDGAYDHAHTSPHSVRSMADLRRPSFIPRVNAAAALAQLHNSRPDSDWDADRDGLVDGDAGLQHYFVNQDPEGLFSDTHGGFDDTKSRLPEYSRTSSVRAASLQPYPRAKIRSRKSSVTEGARLPKHERERSRDYKRWSGERKALSAEPHSLSAIGSKRWEDLLDAAASATEEDSRDLTPIPQSPRGSIPPFHSQQHNHNQFHSYNTSPLQNAILPHSPEEANATGTFEQPSLEAFPSVESTYDASPNQSQNAQYHHHQSSNDSSTSNPYAFQPPSARTHHHHQHPSGSNFHMPAEGLSSSPNDSISLIGRAPPISYSQPSPYSTQQHSSPPLVQHYCAACHRVVPLTTSYVCTECICGICRECVDVLVQMGPDRGARCPRCATIGGRFKPLMLDLR